MLPEQLIDLLRKNNDLSNWSKIMNDGDKEYVTGTWYNMAMLLADNIEDHMDDVTRSMWELGLQVFDWDHFYSILTKEIFR